jgi:hypothetical protein
MNIKTWQLIKFLHKIHTKIQNVINEVGDVSVYSACTVRIWACPGTKQATFIIHVLKLHVIEVQYRETSSTSFMTFWILVWILLKNFIDLKLLLFLFITPLLGIISKVFSADWLWWKRLLCSTFPTVPVFFYQIVNMYNQNILIDNKKGTTEFICRVCVGCIW